MKAVRTAAKLIYLIAREGFHAFDDPDEHVDTKPRRGRCTLCGHRMPRFVGDIVIETRKLPLHKMAAEIPGRAWAILHHPA